MDAYQAVAASNGLPASTIRISFAPGLKNLRALSPIGPARQRVCPVPKFSSQSSCFKFMLITPLDSRRIRKRILRFFGHFRGEAVGRRVGQGVENGAKIGQ